MFEYWEWVTKLRRHYNYPEEVVRRQLLLPCVKCHLPLGQHTLSKRGTANCLFLPDESFDFKNYQLDAANSHSVPHYILRFKEENFHA